MECPKKETLPLHISIISDNGSFAAYLSKLLRSAGHAVTSVPDGEQALRAVRREKPDLLVIAAEAAKLASLAVEQRLQTPQGPRAIPTIAISDCAELEQELLHAFDFLLQPLDVNRFLDDVAALSQRAAGPLVQKPLSDRQYQAFSALLASSTGLHFESRNRSALERGIHKRMSTLRIASCGDYLEFLKRHGESRHEMQKLLQFLTVGETYYFRYPSHFQALRERLLAGCLLKGAPIRIWSAGCSTGEEPYSIAITIMETLPDWRCRDIKIFATDINKQSLKRARDGVYSQWSVRTTDERHLERYFEPAAGGYRIRDEVRRLVEFHHLNLSTGCAGDFCTELHDLDAVFCRNVLIYFSPEQAAGMVEKLATALKPSGQLFLGHAETPLQRPPGLEIRRWEDSFYYVKKEEGKPPSPPAQRRDPAEPPPFAPVDRSARPAARLETARRLFDADDLDGAWSVLETLRGEQADDAGALTLAGFVLAAKGRWQEALDACWRAIALNDLLPEAYFLKGVLLDGCGRLEEAADEYRKALLLDHDFIMPRYYMGRLHLRLGRVPEGAREIRNSIRILAKRPEVGTIPYSGGLTRAACLQQLHDALEQVA